MQKLLIFLALLIGVHLSVGYYTTLDIEDPLTFLFVKKYPTFQLRFENIYSDDAERKSLIELSEVDVRLIRDYCKYRLGVDTSLDTQQELDGCKAL
jgi:hypothetical protein